MPNEPHLTPPALARLLALAGPQAQQEEALSHLASCLRCQWRLVGCLCGKGRAGEIEGSRPTLRPAWPRQSRGACTEESEPTFAPDAAALAAMAALDARERRQAPELWAELAPLNHRQRLLKVINSPRFATLGLVKFLLVRARLAGAGRAGEPTRLAQLALAADAGLPGGLYPPAVRCDFRARAWAETGFDLVREGALPAAEVALELAREELTRGTGDPLERAWLCEAEAALATALGRHPRAAAQAHEAAVLYQASGAPHRAAAAWAAYGAALRGVGQAEEAVAVFEKIVGCWSERRQEVRR